MLLLVTLYALAFNPHTIIYNTLNRVKFDIFLAEFALKQPFKKIKLGSNKDRNVQLDMHSSLFSHNLENIYSAL